MSVTTKKVKTTKPLTPEDVLGEGDGSPQTFYRAVKALLEAQKRGEPVQISMMLEAVEGLVAEYENIFPMESLNYREGDARRISIIRQLTSFKFIAPPKLKDQDKVEWGYKALKDFMSKVEDLTQGNITLEVEIPPKYR